MKISGGAIKDQRQAEYALLVFVIIAIGISLFLFLRSGGSKAKFQAPPGYKIVYPKDSPPHLQPKL